MTDAERELLNAALEIANTVLDVKRSARRGSATLALYEHGVEGPPLRFLHHEVVERYRQACRAVEGTDAVVDAWYEGVRGTYVPPIQIEALKQRLKDKF